MGDVIVQWDMWWLNKRCGDSMGDVVT
jgi:hypothetical protein